MKRILCITLALIMLLAFAGCDSQETSKIPCENCGTSNLDDAKFCQSCGEQMSISKDISVDDEFLATIESAVLERMDNSATTNQERRIAIDAELYQINPFASKDFLDTELKKLATQYIEGLELQREASEAEFDYEDRITWYEGVVTCYEVLNTLYQNYDFLSDNSKFIASYVLQLDEMQALLTAYRTVNEDLSQQCDGELINDFDGTNMSLTFSNNTEYEFSTIWKITYFDKNGDAVGTASAEVENISAGQNYTVYFYVPFPDKTDRWEFDMYFTSVVLPDEDDEELFVAKGETTLMNFLDAASNNGYEIVDPQRDGSYVDAKAKKGNNIFDIRYMVENQKVYMVEIKINASGKESSEYKYCIAGMASSLNADLETSVLNNAIDEAFDNPDSKIIKSETLFLFDESKGVFTITH